MRIALRILVLLLALGAGGLSGYVGYLWTNQVQSDQSNYESEKIQLEVLRMQTRMMGKSQSQLEEAEALFAAAGKDQLHKTRALPFMYGGAIIGLLGGLMAATGRPLCAAGLLVVGSLAPLAVYQSYWLKMPTLLSETNRLGWQTDLFAVLAVGGLLLSAILARLIPLMPGPRPEADVAIVEEE